MITSGAFQRQQGAVFARSPGGARNYVFGMTTAQIAAAIFPLSGFGILNPSSTPALNIIYDNGVGGTTVAGTGVFTAGTLIDSWYPNTLYQTITESCSYTSWNPSGFPPVYVPLAVTVTRTSSLNQYYPAVTPGSGANFSDVVSTSTTDSAAPPVSSGATIHNAVLSSYAVSPDGTTLTIKFISDNSNAPGVVDGLYTAVLSNPLASTCYEDAVAACIAILNVTPIPTPSSAPSEYPYTFNIGYPTVSGSVLNYFSNAAFTNDPGVIIGCAAYGMPVRIFSSIPTIDGSIDITAGLPIANPGTIFDYPVQSLSGAILVLGRGAVICLKSNWQLAGQNLLGFGGPFPGCVYIDIYGHTRGWFDDTHLKSNVQGWNASTGVPTSTVNALTAFQYPQKVSFAPLQISNVDFWVAGDGGALDVFTTPPAYGQIGFRSALA